MRQFATDRASVISSAVADGVARMLVPGIDVETSRAAIALAQELPGQIFAAVGTHPHDASTLTAEALATEHELSTCPEVVAIGEIGLDYYRNLSPPELQREALVSQFALAR